MPYFPPIQQEQYPATDETQCLQIFIPAGDEFKALLAGLMVAASDVNNYANPLSAEADGLAAIWDNAYSQIDWASPCGEPIVEWESLMILSDEVDYGWASYGEFDAGDGGEWVSGVGFVSAFGTAVGEAYQMAQAAMTIDTTTIIEMIVYFFVENGINGGTTYRVATDNSTLAETDDIYDDGGHSFGGTGYLPESSQLIFRVQAGFQTGSGDPGGTATVIAVYVRGLGDKPSQLP